MNRRLLIAALALVTAASYPALLLLAAGAPGVVTTVDGIKHEGEVTEAQDQVIVRAHGVDSVLPREDVLKIDYSTYADRFEATLKAIPIDDTEARVKLAREAFDRHAYDLALKATAAALDFDPMNRDARQLEALINSQIQLEGRDKATTQPGKNDPTEVGPKPNPRPPKRRVPELDDEQINRVRQAELTQEDRVHIQFRDNLRKRFVDSQPDGNYRAFASRNDVDQALTILEKGTPDLADDLIIRNDPKGILAFGRRVQTAIVQGCGTANCHGGNGAGEFRVVSVLPDAATMITNFYLVNNYTKQLDPDAAKGAFTPTSVKLVDRGDAKNSLLYQYAMPRARAKQKHPQVRNWDGLFREDNDRLALALVGWMDGDLARRPREYGFSFSLVPATQPATPATSPAE